MSREAVLNWRDDSPLLITPPAFANNSAGTDGEVTGRHIKRERR